LKCSDVAGSGIECLRIWETYLFVHTREALDSSMNKHHSKLTGPYAHKNSRVFAEIGLPNLLAVWNKGHQSPGVYRGVLYWKKRAREWPALEASLTAWEDANPSLYEAMPWYEEREAFRAAKARGEAVWPQWWELAAAELGLKSLHNRTKLILMK